MPNIKINHITSELMGDAPFSEIRQVLSFKIPTDFHMLRAKMPNKPIWLIKKIASEGRTINLMDLKTKKFPTGLVPRLRRYLDAKGISYIIDDRRKYPHSKEWDCTKTPRDYQEDPIDRAIDKRVGILNLATRSGKTVVSQVISSRIGKPILFVVQSKELLTQSQKSFAEAFPDKEIGIIGGGRYNPKEITITTIQSFLKPKKEHEKLYNYFKVIFFDELHSFGGLAFFKTAMKFTAPWRYGLTGTAFRGDEAGILLNALCGEIISRVTTQELEAKGVVYKTNIIMQAVQNKPLYPMHSRNWRKIYDWGIITNNYRNKLIVGWANKLFRANYTVLVIVKEKSHGEIIKKMILQHVTKSVEFMHGTETTSTRQDVLNKFCLGDVRILIGTKIYNQGIDFVGLKNKNIVGKSVIRAGGGKSSIESIQVSARPTTKEKGSHMEDDAIVVDFLDTFHNKLGEHSKLRKKDYKNIGGFKIIDIVKPLDFKLSGEKDDK